MRILIVFLLFPFINLAQTPIYGAYCRIMNEEMECLQIIDYGTHDGEINPPVSVR